jgi:hypothetical protein
VFLVGCAPTREYRCPDPIGPVVRDDCDAYATRTESAKVALQAGIGPAQIGATFSQEALRSPSELIQVMGQRMLSLCHDFNACRVDNREYQRRREEADQAFTAVMAVLEQLKNPALTPPERERLFGELLAILKGGPPPAPPPPPPPGPPRPPPARGV